MRLQPEIILIRGKHTHTPPHAASYFYIYKTKALTPGPYPNHPNTNPKSNLTLTSSPHVNPERVFFNLILGSVNMSYFAHRMSILVLCMWQGCTHTHTHTV